jgi:GNAT superfamily N-acetyltransferase
MLGDGTYGVPHGKVAVITTHLEMHARAPTKDAPLPEGITFRRVTPDLAWYRDVFTRVGVPDWMWFGRLTLDDAALEALFCDPAVQFYTLAKDGTDEALLELDFRKEGECELAYFGLTPALIGTGAGRYLMDRAIDLAWQGDITRFHLHTCTNDSPQALDFYVRSGFTAYKREVDIEDDPRLTGVLPKDAAPHIPII